MSPNTNDTPAIGALLDLTGRTAIVTGGAMGIGLGITRRLHEAGANVVVADLDASCHAVAEELGELRANSAIGVQLDVSNEPDAQRLATDTVDAFGGIDILVNNAGIFPTVPFVDMEAATFQRVLDVNLMGVFHCTQAVTKRMIERGAGGRIVNITSIDALHPSMVGLAHYDASKHGLWGFTKNIALELAPHQIMVNAIAPGGVVTPGVGDLSGDLLKGFEATIPMRRMGVPDDIARAALFLSSDLASYMTGSQIVVDGGKLLS